MSGLINEMGFTIAKEIARKKDAAIFAEVDLRLRGTDWKMIDLARRLSKQFDKISRSEIYLLDDKPLIQFWPLESNFNQEGHATMVNWTLNFRTFRN